MRLSKGRRWLAGAGLLIVAFLGGARVKAISTATGAASAQRYLLKGESVSVPTTVTPLTTLLDGAAWSAATNVVGVFNCSEGETLYVAVQATAPTAVTQMIPVNPGQGIEFYYSAPDADRIYVAGGAALTARVVQDYQRGAL